MRRPPLQGARLIRCRLLRPAGLVAVPREGEHPGHAQPVAVRSRRDLVGAPRCNAGAMLAAVDLDHNLRLGPGERGARTSTCGGVGADPQGDPLGQGTTCVRALPRPRVGRR